MEFGIFIQNFVPAYRRNKEPDAEHNVIMEDLEMVQAADKAGFKYVWVTEHHFLDEYSHLSANDVVLGYSEGGGAGCDARPSFGRTLRVRHRSRRR